MNGTWKAISPNRLIRLSPARPDMVLFAGPILRGSRKQLRCSHLFPGSETITIRSPGCAAPCHLDWKSLPVAYSVLAHSRLGYSPIVVSELAHHSTPFNSGGNTKRCQEKKSARIVFSGFAPRLNQLSSPASAPPSAMGGARIPLTSFIIMIFIMIQTQIQRGFYICLILSIL